MSDLLKLAERCEAATGPDRELDCAIAVSALGFFVAAPRYEGEATRYGYIDENGSRVEPGQGGDMLVPRFTASIDAAMTLVPEGRSWQIGCHEAFRLMPEHGTYSAWISGPFEGHSATPALALCAASLRARSEAAAVGGR